MSMFNTLSLNSLLFTHKKPRRLNSYFNRDGGTVRAHIWRFREYSYWQFHLTIFAILIPKLCKYPISSIGSKTNKGLFFKTYEIFDI